MEKKQGKQGRKAKHEEPREHTTVIPEGLSETNASDEGKLTNAAGQSWDSEKLDGVSDEFAENVDLREEILRQAGERKGVHRKHGGG